MELKKYWLSYATDERFVGAAIVEAEDHVLAIMLALERGIDPGCVCEVMTLCMGDLEVPEKWMNRMLTRKECMEIDAWIDDLAVHEKASARPSPRHRFGLVVPHGRYDQVDDEEEHRWN